MNEVDYEEPDVLLLGDFDEEELFKRLRWIFSLYSFEQTLTSVLSPLLSFSKSQVNKEIKPVNKVI